MVYDRGPTTTMDRLSMVTSELQKAFRPSRLPPAIWTTSRSFGRERPWRCHTTIPAMPRTFTIIIGKSAYSGMVFPKSTIGRASSLLLRSEGRPILRALKRSFRMRWPRGADLGRPLGQSDQAAAWGRRANQVLTSRLPTLADPRGTRDWSSTSEPKYLALGSTTTVRTSPMASR